VGTVMMKYGFVTKIQVPQHFLFLRMTLKSTSSAPVKQNLATVSQAESGI
jgi:hypothetical protein